MNHQNVLVRQLPGVLLDDGNLDNVVCHGVPGDNLRPGKCLRHGRGFRRDKCVAANVNIGFNFVVILNVAFRDMVSENAPRRFGRRSSVQAGQQPFSVGAFSVRAVNCVCCHFNSPRNL